MTKSQVRISKCLCSHLLSLLMRFINLFVDVAESDSGDVNENEAEDDKVSGAAQDGRQCLHNHLLLLFR